jgi:predicted RNA binding protein YcfA (HicA-like mRNA interferase family)
METGITQSLLSAHPKCYFGRPPKLPVISGQECIKALEKAGFRVSKQKGSHIKLRRAGRSVIVPNHKELDRGTLKSIIEQAGLTVDEFIGLLQ